MARMKAISEPLPLVPATWTTGGRRRSGWPRAASSRSMRPSDRSMDCGCSALRRSSSVTLAETEGSGMRPSSLWGRVVKVGCPLGGSRRTGFGISAERFAYTIVLLLLNLDIDDLAVATKARLGCCRGGVRIHAVEMIGNRDVASGAAIGEQPANAAKRIAKLMAM